MKKSFSVLSISGKLFVGIVCVCIALFKKACKVTACSFVGKDVDFFKS